MSTGDIGGGGGGDAAAAVSVGIMNADLAGTLIQLINGTTNNDME